MSYSDKVIDWALRHGRAAGAPEDHDLVLVADHPALDAPSPSAVLNGQTWRLRRVTGEITLRDALQDAGRLVAILPRGFLAPPDLTGRAWLGRVVQIRPRDLIAALTNRPCDPITDEGLARAIEAALPQLVGLEGAWSVGGPVGVREIRNVLIGLQVGGQGRVDREAPEALLARWLADGPPDVRSTELLREGLRQEHGPVGEWLAWAVTAGSVNALVSAGALAGSVEGATLAADLFTLSGPADRQRLRALVDQAVRAAWQRDPARTRRALEEAERRSDGLDPSLAPAHPLLSRLLERALLEAGRRAAAGDPQPDANLDALSTHLHLPNQRAAYELVRELSRLARFVPCVAPPAQPGLAVWAERARRDVAWGDLAFRRARRWLGEVGPGHAAAARVVLLRYVAARDTLNAAFGQWLTDRWVEVAGQTDVREPFALQHLTRLVVRPLLDRGQRVLLVVLDGCDLASFVELVSGADEDLCAALGLPPIADPDLAQDLRARGPWRVALAPLPTITSHARRALFAGELPRAAALDLSEDAAANASHDKGAFQSNPALGRVPRTLLLKGDVGDLGEAVRVALKGQDRLVAVVLNDVDDALSSKETTPAPPWRLGGLSGGAARWLGEALDQGWCVLVTADHGHTPYVASDRKLALGGVGARIASEPGAGVVTARRGPLPSSPLHLLTGFGAWRGTQHRGWHGGASLEEVFVPLAFLTRGAVHHESFSPPAWWTRMPEGQDDEVLVAPSQAVPDDVAEALRLFPQGLALVRMVFERGAVGLDDLSGHLNLTVQDISQLIELVSGFLARARTASRLELREGRVLWGADAPAPGWLSRVEDELDRKLLAYLDEHGAITERDLVELAGSPRRARRFSGRVEELSALAPFRVVVDSLPDGTKRYSTVKG